MNIAENEMENVTENTEGTSTGTLTKRGRPTLIPEDLFIETWQNAVSLDEVVDVLFAGVEDRSAKKLYCSMRAANLRKKYPQGTLKIFPRGRKAGLIQVEDGTKENADTDLAQVAE